MGFAGVLFDFHKTLVVAGSLESWLRQSVDASGEDDVADAEILAALRSVWARAALRYPDTRWDLDSRLHRAVFREVLEREADCTPTLADILDDTMSEHWVAVPGAIELLERLRAGGHRIGMVSNTGIDLRPRLAELGLLAYLDTVVLSFEEGLVKPDPRIFRLAADRLGLPVSECLFVGDDPRTDGGAVQVGMTTALIPQEGGGPQLHRAAAFLGVD
ncbi:HAD family hydrolase [Serinicoccus marinus]|uniref:HAD family hydrolase n=1 Tax=Serinicoccus marinus TaxID=247333 RepID=UPI002493831F|nr:HAD family hydrolase [Serinicoccus marinus]